MKLTKSITTTVGILLLSTFALLLQGCQCPCEGEEGFSQPEENVLQYTGDLPDQPE
ncbi:hypothetical protein STSP2_01303 [Anaerohalosphaera lusitana]|uniref:Secreted protein n=1 Tax=Anaerohalosphaera lusitana TaxID=1936003 RepID=A0A1U9NK80_9BACT|nr:hypothetical protein [Anaerohalosphaera lusitana]AQT68148.1 hypothetical protein STSP2_01303 [Anaerohalosphaera lusitana]